MKKFNSWMLAAFILAASNCFVSCDDDENNKDGSTINPVEETVAINKKHDTAILLCTFGSTFEESIKSYDGIVEAFQSDPTFKDADIYLSFTSRTCVNLVFASTGIERYQPDLWLDAFGKAGYKRVAVQSLHIIPGEEYLSLMNTDVKKNFMALAYPDIQVVKGKCLLYEKEDVEKVADALYNHYTKDVDVLENKNNILLLMGHGNPDNEYTQANTKYSDMEKAMQAKASNKNVFVGTVDYGDMLFYPQEEGAEVADTYIYSKLNQYCKDNNLKPEDITVYMAPFMSIAGDHAHNDMWGLEDGDDYSHATPDADCSWKLKIRKMGFKIADDESHNGNSTKCTIKGLGDYPAIRQVWVNHLKQLFVDDAWESWNEHLE